MIVLCGLYSINLWRKDRKTKMIFPKKNKTKLNYSFID